MWVHEILSEKQDLVEAIKKTLKPFSTFLYFSTWKLQYFHYLRPFQAAPSLRQDREHCIRMQYINLLVDFHFFFFNFFYYTGGFPGGSDSEESACNAEDMDLVGYSPWGRQESDMT